MSLGMNMDTTHVLHSPLDLGRYWAMVHYGGPIEATGPKQDDSDAILATLEIVRGNSANQPGYDIMTSGEWRWKRGSESFGWLVQ
jgi:hypothetical protein